MANSSSARAAAAWITPRRSPRAQGCASLIEFDPLAVHHIPIPAGLGLPGGQQPADRREIGRRPRALQRASARPAPRRCARRASLVWRGHRRPNRGRTVRARGSQAPAAGLPARRHRGLPRAPRRATRCRRDDADRFGRILLESHASLRDRLQVSCPALDRLVEAAMDSGASARASPAPVSAAAPWSSAAAPTSPRSATDSSERFYSGCRGSHSSTPKPGRGAVHS